jgi:uncharacterized protein YyaL (SSP411 family)
MHSMIGWNWRWLGVLLTGLAIVASGRAPQAAEGTSTPNRLAKETSPYLLQHARNPVDWYPWGPEAFAKAKREDKPIFLSVGYSACHWCHVMERESFEDAAVARLLNDHFVAIKVDQEERPDIDDLYMTAVLLLTNRGGWPLSVFLTPDGKPFHGGTYFPRDDFMELLRRVNEAWTKPEERKQVEAGAEKLSGALSKAVTRAAAPGNVTPSQLGTAAESLLDRFDDQHGGFSGAPKFPPPMRLGVLLAQHRRKPSPKLLKAVTLTLDKMARGGMYDHVGGGFHRYSTDDRWLVPHFEKMLYDQALLAWIYLEAYRETQNEDYRRVAAETLEFTLRELRDPGGAFWSTLDADSSGEHGKKEEGAYYVWTPRQVAAVLGAADGALFNRVYGVTNDGNFDGRSIPNLVAKPLSGWAKDLKTTPEALEARLSGMRKKLAAARAKRAGPSLDDKVQANWNGLMIRSLALAYDLTGETKYRKAAEEAATFVLSKMRVEAASESKIAARRLGHSYRAGKVQPQAFLEDYAFLTVGLQELHQATREPRWLEDARTLADMMVADFWDEERGHFYNTPHGHEKLVARAGGVEDGAMPAGQSMAALALVRLGRQLRQPESSERALRVLNTFSLELKRSASVVPSLLLAAYAHFAPATEAAPPSEATVKVTVESDTKAIKDGQELDLRVRLAIRTGWHIGAVGTGFGAGVLPTTVELAPGPFRQVSRQVPAPKLLATAFSKEPLQVLEGESVVRLKVKVLPGGAQAEELRVRIRYQSCNDQVCERPVDVTVPLKLR